MFKLNNVIPNVVGVCSPNFQDSHFLLIKLDTSVFENTQKLYNSCHQLLSEQSGARHYQDCTCCDNNNTNVLATDFLKLSKVIFK